MARVSTYVGIDVACAKGKRLPLCFVTYQGDQLVPLRIPVELRNRVPRGLGNAEIKSEHPFRRTADELADALLDIAGECGWSIQCVAIDAPAAHPEDGSRTCERALSKAGISCFYTPNRAQW